MSTRVNHKIVRERLNEKRSKISDSKFFSSRILAGHYEDIIAAQARRYQYNRRVRVDLYWQPKNPEVAYTDNAVIHVNTGNSMVTKIRGRENRYQMVNGIIAHEFGHVMYTDFLLTQSRMNAFEAFRWFPNPPALLKTGDIMNEKEFWDYIKADEKNRYVIMHTAHNIDNILEDGYIENRVLCNFPGMLGTGLKTLRKNQFDDLPTVTQLIEKEQSGEMHILESILDMMLSYAKFGEIKYGDEPLSDERIQTVFGLISDIDKAVYEHPISVRFMATNLILIRCWKYVKDFCETVKDKLSQLTDDQDFGEAAAGLIGQILGALAGNTANASGNSAPVQQSPHERQGRAGIRRRSKTKADANGSQNQNGQNQASGATGSEQEKPEEEKKANSTGSGEANQQPENDGADSGSGQSEDGSELGGGENTGKQDVSEGEDGRLPLINTDSVYDPEGGTFEENNDYEPEKYENSGRDIETLLDKMAEKAACQELESERLKELNEAAQNISYGDVHKGISVRVNRISSVRDGMIDQYNYIAEPLLLISRQLQRSISKQLKDQRQGGKQTGLVMGRRLDAHALHRNDGRVFYKNRLPNETPQLAVGLLLDESGSMRSQQRCVYARAAAIILYDFCQSLDIPITIYGHTTGYSDGVELYSYAEFDSFDDDDKYRLMDIGARSCNRDGAALRYIAEKLSKRPEEAKILILVSDGQPNGTGYVGTAAEEDLRGIKQEYQRKGIMLVAAAIGEDKESIERIYGDSFMDITDLNQLPVKLTAVVKRHIKV